MITNVSDLEKEIRKRLPAALKSSKIEDIMRDCIVQSAEKDVYAVGQPERYHRRKANGGLIDKENMPEEYMERPNGAIALYVYDRTPENGGQYQNGELFEPLATKLEKGYGAHNTWYNQSRPFMSDAQKLLNSKEDQLKTIIQQAIKGR